MELVLVLGLSGAVVAWFREVPLSFLNGLLISYFVVTSFSVIKQKPGSSNLIDRLMAGTAVMLTGGYIYYAVKASQVPGGELGGFGSSAFIVFGAVALVCVVFDIRFVLKGGLVGKARILRHLWRMFFPLFMATAAFFLGQAKLFPEALQNIAFLLFPVALILILMVCWIAIVILGQRYASREKQIRVEI